MNKMPLQTN